jgi:hypothetical protein
MIRDPRPSTEIIVLVFTSLGRTRRDGHSSSRRPTQSLAWFQQYFEPGKVETQPRTEMKIS